MIFRRAIVVALFLAAASLPGLSAQQPGDLNDLHEKAIKDAVKKISPSVVQIVTLGGTDMIATGPKGPTVRKGLGPTTGVVVSSDGFVISSAFNFANNPTAIQVAVPGHKEPLVAKRIATDLNKMLTLLKIDANNLPVPPMVPSKQIKEGQWSIALGRSLDLKRDAYPSISLGIISATGRIWGKAIQTDAKVSPLNYGGPIIDIEGRVQGILIPASPREDGTTAGFEWYDSGIGFAIPFEDVLKALPRLKEGKDLHKGLFGVAMKSQDIYNEAPIVGQVTPNSAAARAGIKPGDLIQAIDNHPVANMAQIRHLLGPKYEGDKITIKYKRGDKELVAADIVLAGALQSFTHAFLGILPLRDDPKLGVAIRHVYPKSPAEKAGLKPGDRIVKFGAGDKKDLSGFSGQKRGRDEFTDFLNTQLPGTDLKLEVERKEGKKDTLTVTLEAMPGTNQASKDEVPDKLPSPASVKKAQTPLESGDPNVKPPKLDPMEKQKPKTGLLEKKSKNGEHEYSVFIHDDYDPNVAQALVVWFHLPGKNTKKDFEDFTDAWEDYCKDHNIIVLLPKSGAETGWVPGDADYVADLIREAQAEYTIDPQRIIAHGMGIGGQMAIHQAFHSRDLIRGVAGLGAVATQPKDNVPNQRLAFFLVAGDRDPLIKAIVESKTKLIDKRFPVVYIELENLAREYLNAATHAKLARWIDSLDRQ